jgi:hypothetical protein
MPHDMDLFGIRTLIFICKVFSPASVIFAGFGILLSVGILLAFVWANVTPKFLRQLRILGKAKKLLSTSLSG